MNGNIMNIRLEANLPATKQFIFIGDISPDYPPAYLLPLIDEDYDQQSECSYEFFYNKL